MPQQIVVIGASAGGLEALRTLAGALPCELSVPICVVLHSSAESPGLLDQILSRSGPLRAVTARDGERLCGGKIYVPPPDRHLLVEPGRLRVAKGPREHRFRPAIDPLFRSAAQVLGPGAIGVILTGSLDDGTAGLWAIKQLGGIAVAQDPDEALFPSMPRSAIDHVRVDHIVALSEVAPLLIHLTSQPVAGRELSPVPEQMEIEVKIAKDENALDAGVERLGKPSIFACPECHGVLLQFEEGTRIRFRCHTGHAYSIESLQAAINEAIEESFWNAIRALEEGSLLMQRIADHLRTAHPGRSTAQVTERAEEIRRQAEAIRKLATEREPLSVANY